MARAVVLLAALAVPTSAQADEQPAILKAYDLDWIERVREDAWPQPKSERPVICLLDTGVDITPDTPADNPDGPIVARLALDGGTGVAQGTTWEHQHGTQMASIIAAPRNGYGTVGVFPQARIVSIRVTDSKQEEVYITPQAVAQGVRTCFQWSANNRVPASVVVIAETNYEERVSDVPAWQDAANYAAARHSLVVAAAGNLESSKPVASVATPTMLTVAAGGRNGDACPFAEALDQQTALRGPGCDVGPSWSPGSSAAAAVVGAFAGALSSRNPGFTDTDLRRIIESESVPMSRTLGRVSGRGEFTRMAEFVTPLVTSQPAAPSSPPSPLSDDRGSVRTVLWRPVLEVTRRGRSVHVRRTRRLQGVLHVEYTIGSRRVQQVFRGRRFSFRPDRKASTFECYAVSKAGEWRSLTTRWRFRP